MLCLLFSILFSQQSAFAGNSVINSLRTSSAKKRWMSFVFLFFSTSNFVALTGALFSANCILICQSAFSHVRVALIELPQVGLCTQGFLSLRPIRFPTASSSPHNFVLLFTARTLTSILQKSQACLSLGENICQLCLPTFPFLIFFFFFPFPPSSLGCLQPLRLSPLWLDADCTL